MNSPHLVFVDSTLAGLLAFKSAKEMGCRVTFVEPLDSSFLQIFAADASRIQTHLANADNHIKIPTLSNGALTDAIRDISKTGKVDAIITTSEAAILAVAQTAREIGLLAPRPGALEAAVFKDRCRAALINAGLRSPRFEVMTEEQLIAGKSRTIQTPLVVKPTRGFGKQFSAVCHTEAELSAFVESLAEARRRTDPMINLIVNNDYIIEEYVVGTLHSTEVVVVDGDAKFFATTTRYRSRHNDLLEMGYSMPADLESSKQIAVEDYVRDVLKAVGIDFGLYHVELIYGSDGPYLVEINGRMMGGVGPQVYQSVSGRDAFELLVRLHLGENVTPDPCEIKGAATVILIGAKDEGIISASFVQEQLDALLQRYGITFCTLRLEAGARVRKFEGNLSVLGHVIVPAADSVSSSVKGHEFLLELEKILGFDVSKYADAAESRHAPPKEAESVFASYLRFHSR